MLVVHIGPKKTATTYLQQNFYQNRAALMKRGWLYPVLSVNAQNAHHEVVSSLDKIRANQGRISNAIARAGKLAAKENANILISSENFRKWTAADYRMLGERFGQSGITIAYTLRDPIDRLLSVWGENVKAGRTQSLEAFARKQLADPLKSGILNCLVELAPIEADPALSLKVLNFPALNAEGADIYEAFGRHVLGLSDLTPARQTRSNETFPAEILDYLRLLSRRTNYDPASAERLMSRQFSRCHSPEEIGAIAAAVRSADAAETIDFTRDDPWYGELQDRVSDMLGPRILPAVAPSGRLFPTGSVVATTYDIERLSRSAAVESLVEMSAARMQQVTLPFKRGRIARTWRYLKRLISV